MHVFKYIVCFDKQARSQLDKQMGVMHVKRNKAWQTIKFAKMRNSKSETIKKAIAQPSNYIKHQVQ